MCPPAKTAVSCGIASSVGVAFLETDEISLDSVSVDTSHTFPTEGKQLEAVTEPARPNLLKKSETREPLSSNRSENTTHTRQDMAGTISDGTQQPKEEPKTRVKSKVGNYTSYNGVHRRPFYSFESRGQRIKKDIKAKKRRYQENRAARAIEALAKRRRELAR
jgi:hypothetical protein